ncbi:MAG: methylated-DNA--[protein]-cysteine S-methyltransferase [Rickettsiales bacterium]|jgi:methylated-DNA-[protein]-cysteine S-methyltransferase|nr:methylated-DNA--[protein]-cysteine S-methyltransferase [Rickettsiales bacterium]
MYGAIFDTKIGTLLAKATNESITNLEFATNYNNYKDNVPILKDLKKWIDNYLNGGNPKIDFNLSPHGTDFQKKIWDFVSKISYGKTATYTDIANIYGNKNSVRAIGQAIKTNPILLLIPCHRIVAKNCIGGYCGKEKIEIKELLLKMENNSK